MASRSARAGARGPGCCPRPRRSSSSPSAALVALVLLASGWAAERGLRARELAHLEHDLEREALLVRELVAGERPSRPARTPSSSEAARARPARSSLRVTLIAPDGTRARGLGRTARRARRASRTTRRAPRSRRRSPVGVGHDARLSAQRRPPLPLRRRSRRGGARSRRGARRGGPRRHRPRGRARCAASCRARAWPPSSSCCPWRLLLSHLALRPLREIAEVVGSIAEGDLDRRLPRGAPDEFGRIAAAVNEMAEQLRARLRELTEDKERLQAVLAGMVEGVLVVDAEQRVVLANPRLRELFGFRGAPSGGPTGRWCAAPTCRRPSPRRRSRRSRSWATSRRRAPSPGSSSSTPCASRRAVRCSAWSPCSTTSPRSAASSACGATSWPTSPTS